MRLARRVLLAVAALGAVGAAVALALRWVDAAVVPVVVVQSALPLFGVLAAVCTVIAALCRGWWVAVAALAVSVGFVAVGAPALQRRTVDAGPDTLTVVAINLEYGQGDATDVVREVRALGADIVVLAEVTPEKAAALDAAGLGEYSHRSGIALDGAKGLVVASRLPAQSIDWGPDYPMPWSGATARVTTPRGAVVVKGAHTYAPNLHTVGPWRRSMGEYEQWMQTRHRDEPVIVAGDFNGGWGHPAFRALADGYTDASHAAGLGWVRTWPLESSMPPYTQLDHVLVRGLDVVDAGTFTVRSTDHAGVWARLRLR